ncbi:cadherin-like and PC-esterase domain-containing protein 1 [Anabrus simplex]|uniref:cadherin-like and PC-esterase domain-containing protein 1 n=1 Tax=Anabrus simplex TaxID=316456 RepID=UPI0035A350E6
MALRFAVQLSCIRDLLVVVISFSLLSLYLTYRLGFPAGRLQAVDQSLDRLSIAEPPELQSPLRSQELHQLLVKIENEQLTRKARLVAHVRGYPPLLHRELAFYSRMLQARGFNIATDAENSTDGEDWTLLLCLAFSDGDTECLPRDAYLGLRPHQKVSRLPGLRGTLWRRPGLCRTASRLASLNSLHSNPLTPACFALPEQYEEFLNAADGPGFNSSWVLKPSSPGGKMEHMSTMQIFNRVRLKEFPEMQESLVQEFVPNQLRVFGFPVSVQLFVLVTSVAPLRAYIFNEGLVSFRYGEEKNYKKIPGKWWLLSQLWRHIAATHGTSAVKMALDNTDALLVHLLLGAEAFLLIHLANFPSVAGDTDRQRYRCEHCFQLLAVDLLYNTSFYPLVMDVNGQPGLGADGPAAAPAASDNGRPQESLRRSIVGDMFKLLFATDRVHNDVFEALQSVAEVHNAGVTGMQCLISHALCLTQDDLASLLTARREDLNSGDFRRIYPSPSGGRHSSFVHELQQLMLQDPGNMFQEANFLLRESLRHGTADLHELLTRLEELLASQDITEDDYSYPSEPRLNYASFNLQSLQAGAENSRETRPEEDCATDPALAAYLKAVHFEPSVSLDPPFTPLWTEYNAHVPYDLTMVRISATPLYCKGLVRFEHRLGPVSALNTTLGIGINHITLLLQETTTGATLNTYSLNLHRHKASYGEPRLNPSQKYAVCSLRQECEYRISPNEPCGLQQEHAPGTTTWAAVLGYIQQLPPCASGDAFGRWLVPCASCSSRDSCIWSQSRWQPYTCTHHTLDRSRLASCLQGKKLLFLGDSTNRGMMHYIMERLNGSLAACDKTHHIRVYNNMNQGQTTLSFAYYPQFWLTAPDRPVFDKTLYQLLLKSQPLQNTSNTVLIVGGVHWLATQHLHTLLRILRREGLQGAHLVVKTLGSGFHIPAEGVHFLTKIQQEKLLKHSLGLAAFAHHFNMEVVDTFNITAARYKDFLQGKCACHFHKLEERPDVGYHVEGPINAIYTEILLSRLCSNAT